MNIQLTPRLEKAIRIAAWAHNQQPQFRKGTDIPYVIHPFSVMLVASEATTDEDVLIACLFHDILEDVDPKHYSEATMRQEFGDRVTNIVLGVTKNDDLTDWQERSDAYLNHLEHEASDESVIVSASDKIHNLMSMLRDYEEIGEALWDKFNAPKDRQLWWYQEVCRVIQLRLPDLPLNDKLQKTTAELEAIIRP